MKYDLYFIFNYWRIHWRRALTILSSYILMAVFVFTSFSMLRTEFRRIYFDAFNAADVQTETSHTLLQSGAYNEILRGLDENTADAFEQEEYIGMTGRLYTKCYLGSPSAQFTYGAYMDEAARELSGIRMLRGRFPENPGETAVSELALLDMGMEAEIGDSIPLTEYDDKGNPVRDRTFTLTGIFLDTGERTRWETVRNDALQSTEDAFEPVILLSPADMDAESSILSVMFRFEYSDRGALPEELVQAQWDTVDRYLKPDIVTYGMGEGSYDSSYFAQKPTDSYSGSLIYGKGRFYQYACTAAAAVMALSLLCSLFAVLPDKIASMRVLRGIGYTYARLRRMLFLESILFTLAGIVFGFLAAMGCCEILLQLQHHIFGLDLCRAYHTEWGIRQVTFDPFAMTLLFTSVTSILAFAIVIFGLKRLMLRDGKAVLRLPVSYGSFHMNIWKIFSRPFVHALQICALVLVLVVSCAASMFFSIRGKDGEHGANPQFANGQGAFFETELGLNMEKNSIDCVIASRRERGGMGLVQDQPPEEGLGPDAVNRLSESSRISRCCAWTRVSSLYACYGSTENPPRGLSKLKDTDFAEGEKQSLDLGDKNLYRFKDASIMIVNDSMLGSLGIRAEAMKDGKAFLLYSGARAPFEGQKDAVPCYSCYGRIDGDSTALGIEKHAVAFSLEFAGAEPLDEMTDKQDELSYQICQQELYNSGCSYLMLFSQTGASQLGLMHGRFNNTYLTYAEHTRDVDIRKLLGGVNLKESGLMAYTLSERQQSYNQMKLKENVTVFTVFGFFMVLALTGYFQAARLEMAQRRRQVSTLRAVGSPRKKLRRAIMLKLMAVPVISCILSAAAVSGLQGFLEQKNMEIETAFFDVNDSTHNNTDPVYIQAYEEYAENKLLYLTNYEMWKVPIQGTFACLSLFILACLLIFSYAAAAKAVKQEIIPEKEE